MAGIVQALNNLIVREKWTVALPQTGVSKVVESDKFYLESVAWKFQLQTWDPPSIPEQWSIRVMRCDGAANYTQFWIAAYVVIGTSVYYLAHKQIAMSSDPFWTQHRDSFLKSYPSIKDTGKIDFRFVILNPRKVPNELLLMPAYKDDRLCLNNLSLALRKLVDEGSDSDVQLKCGECSIAAHKLILGTRSEVFRTMLQTDMLEKRRGIIDIVDMEPKVCEVFIRYLYAGSLPELTEDTATSLYEAADKYRVEALRARCGVFLAEILTRENALRILAMAEAHGDEVLKDKVGTYVLKEKMPSNEVEWSKFCGDHPKVANEVLNRAYKQFSLK